MKKYIIYCSIVVVSVFASFLFFDKYYKKSPLLGEIDNTYVFSYDPPLIIGNVEIEELSKFNQTLADQFPDHHVYATYCGKEYTLTVIILYDYDTDFSYTDRERLWKLICEWQDSLWYKQDIEQIK